MARERKVHVETNEARGGSTPNVVRWVLGISLVAAIVLLSAVWIVGAASQDEEDGEISVSNQIQDEQDRSGLSGVATDEAPVTDATTTDDPLDVPNDRADEPAALEPAQ